ncbi:MAG: efflux RND transporter periplasmic adaptor subunit [Candidatus Brocadiia bacterium]
MKKVFILLVVIAACVAAYLVLSRRKANEDPNLIRLSGNIETTEADLSFKMGGLLMERLVTEGDPVSQDQVIARLDTSDIDAEIAMRKADVVVAEAALTELEAGSRPEEIGIDKANLAGLQAILADLVAGARVQEITAAEATLERASTERIRAGLDYERQKKLLADGTITPREFESSEAVNRAAMAAEKEAQARLQLLKAGARPDVIEQARANVEAQKQRLELRIQGVRKETLDTARARIDSAKSALAASRVKLTYSVLRSPLTGVVLSKSAEPGEYLSPGTTVLSVGVVKSVFVRAYLPESELGRIIYGKKAIIRSDSYPGKSYEGHITFIAQQSEFTPKSVQTTKERVKLVYRIKIEVPNPSGELKAGMPVDVEIRVGPTTGGDDAGIIR